MPGILVWIRPNVLQFVKYNVDQSASLHATLRRPSPGACCSIGIGLSFCGSAALALDLDDLELYTIRALEEADASAITRDHFL